jgi:hypothetical protein
MLAGEPAPTGPTRRGAKPPVFPVTTIDDAALPELLAEMAAGRADEMDADTVNRELSIARLGTQWQSRTGAGLVIVSSCSAPPAGQSRTVPGPAQPGGDSRATAGHAPAHLSVSTVVQQMNSHPDKPAHQHISLSLLGLTGEPPDFLEGGSFWSVPRP